MFKTLLIWVLVCTAIAGGEPSGRFEVEQTVTELSAKRFPRWNKRLEPFTFCVICDPHGREEVREGYEAFGSALDKFELVLSHISVLSGSNPPAFILVCGDNHLEAIKEVADQSGFVFHFVAGNHETKEDRAFLRKSYPGDFNINGVESDYYSFVHNGCRFVGICNAVANEHVGQLSSEQILPFGQSEWLRSELKKKEPIKVVFGHIPPHPESEDVNMFLSRNDSLFFNDLIKRTKPALMFFGHQHRPTRQIMIGSTRCYIARSTAWNFKNDPIGYMFVRFDKNGARIEEYIFRSVPQDAE